MLPTHDDLRKLLQGPEILVAPGVYDALSALIATQAGAKAIYLSGASIAYTHMARSDIGLTSMKEVADILTMLRDRLNTPIIVDGDDGFGNALNVQRTVRLFERAGANAIQLEDQASPKRCGHLAGKRLISSAEMVGKIKAAQDARSRPDTLIIARTDAIAVEGFEAALARAECYVEAGADVLFIEAPETREHMQTLCRQFKGRIPLMANIVEGGRTPSLDAAALQTLGYSLVIFPGGAVRALAWSLSRYYQNLLDSGTTAGWHDKMLNFDQLNELIGTPALIAQGKAYAAEEHSA